MAEIKTKKTTASVADYIAGLKDPAVRADATTLVRMMEKATGEKARMWGSIIGVRDIHLRYATGREVDWFAIGFAPRKSNLSLYLGCGAVDPQMQGMLAKLGPHRMGAGCLYVKRLADVDMKVLGAMIDSSAKLNAAHSTTSIAPTAPAKSQKPAKTQKPAKAEKPAKSQKPAKPTAKSSTVTRSSRGATSRTRR